MRRSLSLTAIVGLALLPSARAQELGVGGGVSPLYEHGRFSIVIENDLFYGGDTDRFYTNGLYLHSDWRSPWLAERYDWLAWDGFEASTERAYVGFGASHELHTPQTINPCGQRYDDELATPDAPRGVDPDDCRQAEQEWAADYADDDRPFSAVGSVFVTAQKYFHSGESSKRAWTQYRLWGRVDLGTYGRGAALGYEVQKNWHGFFNDAFVTEGRRATTPTGWRAQGDDGPVDVLAQVAAGTDVNVLRLAGPQPSGRLGVELDARAQTRLGVPRDIVGAGVTIRGGVLPQHSRNDIREEGEYQGRNIYLEAATTGSLVILDRTFGTWNRYQHFLDEHSFGIHGKFMGLKLGASLHWRRILFEDPLRTYPSRATIADRYHRYGRFALEFTY